MDIEINIDEKNGSVSGRYLISDSCTHLIILAHGAGAGMDHAFMQGLAHALLDQNIGSLRFNFPYMEKGKGRPDHKSVATHTISKVIQYASEVCHLPLVAAGKSFGGRMASHLLASHPSLPVKSLVLYGYPLHPPGKPSTDRAVHLKEVGVPMLFLQGTRDSLAKLELLTPLLDEISLAKLDMLEGADHGFRFLKKLGIDSEEMFKLLATRTSEFLHLTT